MKPLKTSIVLLVSLLVGLSSALLEREKGLNDWHLEHLGALRDLKFLEQTNLAYTLSTTNVLTLFDTEKQEIKWKKELDEDQNYKLRYLSRNLLAYSEKRALLINSASHIIYDVQFDSAAPGLAVEFFELKGHVYSVFAKGDQKILIYKDYQQVGEIRYDSIGKYQTIRPLQMIYDRASQQLILLAQTDESVMQTFTVDVASQELKERQNDLPMPSNVVEALRTRHYFALKQEDQVMFYQATDVQQQVFLGSAHDIETSLLDDLILVRPHNGIKPRFFSVALNKEEKLGSVVESTCTVSRALESETIDIKEKELLYYAVQCKNFLGLFSMKTANPSAVEVVFKTQGGSKLGTSFHGFLRKAFRNSNSLIVQLGDLTLHLMDIEKVQKVWTREEGLSQIKQVEVIQQKAVRIESELEYVKNVKEEAGISTVTSRILNRYKENLNYLVNHLSGIVTPRSSAAVKDSLDNLFGFKKVFLMLTDVGRLVALSATDGKVQWAEYFGGNVEKVIVRNILDSEIKEKGENTQTQQIAVILNDEIRFLDPKTGQKQKEFDLATGVKREFIIISMSKSGAQFILAVVDEALETEKPLIAYPPDVFTESLMVGESIFFTHVDNTKNTLTGYKLRKDLVAVKVWQINFARQGEKFVHLESQFQTASTVDHLHFTPTAFSGENIIYKHLDSNLFALATVSKDTEGDVADLYVYLINGVSGKVIHKYFEKNVRLNLPIDFVLSENLFILSFQRQDMGTLLTHQELTVTELFSQRQEDNTKKLLMEFYTRGEERLLQREFSSFLIDQPVVVQESYVLPFTVKAMALTQTLHHITGKNLVVLTHNGLLYQIDNALFSARRPHTDNLVLGEKSVEEPKKADHPTAIIRASDLKVKELPPYDAVIPIISTKYISYGLPLVNMKDIKTFPTRLESTTQVLSIGFDLFFTRLSPETTFDLLQESFNYTLLFVFIAGLALATVLVRNYAIKTKRENAFLIM